MGSPGSARPSYSRTFYKVLEATKIIIILCVQSRSVCVGGRRDQQVHDAGTRLPTRLHNASRVSRSKSEKPSEVILI